MVAEVFHNLKGVLKKAGHNTNVGDEGGFAPNLDNEEAIKYILDAVDKAGYKAGRDKDIAIALDLACSELFEEGEQEGLQVLEVGPGQDLQQPADGRAVRRLARQVSQIVSIEDPLDQDDWSGYAASPRHWAARSRSSATTSTSPTPNASPRASPRAAPTAS